ncbi:MAG: CBS domain-containing protein [Deltaproteobacteria bacterium]|nr:CBS domain-containing protein [Deltaproteobacteria bacterium]
MNPRNGTYGGNGHGRGLEEVRGMRGREDERGVRGGREMVGERDVGRGELSTREGPFGRARDRDRERSSFREGAERGEREEQRGPRRWRRGGLRARDIMTRNPRAAQPTDTVQQIAQIMIDEDCGIVPITEADGRLLGVVTDRDIVCRLVAHGIDMREARARDVMTDDVECVTEDESLHAVLRLMSEHQVRRIPVVARGDRLMGIIAMADVAREADVDEELQDTFDDISSERTFWSRMR